MVKTILTLIVFLQMSYAQKFLVSDGQFHLNGKPFRIFSGEMHYTRIPQAYWRDRMLKAKSMGLNTICTYVFWNVHEPTRGEFTFEGNLDIRKFIQTAQETGLYVLLRPGPYVCSEWDFGGLPAWLLKDPEMKIRCLYPQYWEPAKTYLERLGRELQGLSIENGGPIIAVQVENEYGSYGNDKEYLRQLRNTLRHSGFDCLLYTSDGPNRTMLEAGTLEDVLPTVNFSSDPEGQFKHLEQFRQNIPHMNGEFWSGWFTQWGHEKWGGQDLKKQREDVCWMLENGKSINFYMFHGGTNFGFTAGANWYNGRYWADITSYDYGAPLTEDGRPTEAFFAFRDLLKQHQLPGTALPDLPAPVKRIAVSDIRLTKRAGLFENLPGPVTSVQPRPMEAYGQNFGFILYRTTITGSGGKLKITALNDYAQVFVDGKLIGSMDRRFGQDTITVPSGAAEKRVLDILVENLGRINFSAYMIDRKGITERVTLDWITLMDWEVYNLPMEPNDMKQLRFSEGRTTEGPMFFKGTFRLGERGDTFLDMRKWRKGVVWVNGHNLGRYWKAAGPQYDLYLPGAWLKEGENEIVVFDLELADPAPLKGESERRTGGD
ncbi:MAG TPA: glycoside hydrolase family 35 protein [Bacteroidota bacterium]|nr:glycoside hydrolase family 35 protein [Bacteroidota bacterium]